MHIYLYVRLSKVCIILQRILKSFLWSTGHVMWWDSQVVITDQEQGGFDLSQDLLITIIEFSLLRVWPGCWDLSLTSEHTAQFQMMMSQSFVNFHMSLWSAGTWPWSGGKLFWILSIFAAERDRYNTLWLRLIFTQNKTRLIWSGCDKQLFLSIICSGLVTGV